MALKTFQNLPAGLGFDNPTLPTLPTCRRRVEFHKFACRVPVKSGPRRTAPPLFWLTWPHLATSSQDFVWRGEGWGEKEGGNLSIFSTVKIVIPYRLVRCVAHVIQDTKAKNKGVHARTTLASIDGDCQAWEFTVLAEYFWPPRPAVYSDLVSCIWECRTYPR